jgi:arabinofuranosyltransferase
MTGALPSAGRASVVVFVVLVIVADALWSAGYVQRTSFEREGERVFCLWDDAMISMRYARNLVEGHGLVWNPGGEHVQGYTNLGVTLVMAALHLLPLGPTRVSLAFQVLNVVALGAVLLLVGQIARRRLGGDVVAAASMIAVALCAPLHLWSLQGSDVGPVTLFTLIALAGVARVEETREWPRWIFPWLAVGVSLRPDFTLVYGVFLVGWLRAAGITPRRLAAGIAPLAVVWGLLVALSLLYYGDPLPNTFYLKATGAPRGLMLESGLLGLSFWLPGAVTAGALAAIAVLAARRNPVVEIAAGLVVVTLGYDIWVGGDWKSEFGSRYVAPVLPLLLMLAGSGAERVAGFALGSALPGMRAAMVLAIAVATSLLAAPQLALRDWFDPSATPMLRSENERNYDLARYIDRNTLPGTTIGVHYGGVPPYFGERRAVDVLGKSDRHIARLEVDRFIPGHSKWDWDYVLEEKQPDIFLVQTRGLAEEPRFRQRYVVVRKGDDLRFFMRRESLDKLTDVDVVLVDPRTGARRPRSDRSRAPLPDRPWPGPGRN